MQAQEGDIYFTELTERVEYGNYALSGGVWPPRRKSRLGSNSQIPRLLPHEAGVGKVCNDNNNDDNNKTYNDNDHNNSNDDRVLGIAFEPRAAVSPFVIIIIIISLFIVITTIIMIIIMIIIMMNCNTYQ